MSAFRTDIEGLRALSIALVVVYHYAGPALPGGFVGVDVFFVISGYLITHSLQGAHRPGERLRDELFGFWARRARRLLPHALAVLAAVAAAGALWLDDVAASRLGSDVGWAAGYAINWLYVLRAVDYLRWGETDASVLLNFWSLAVEEQFYLLWPVALLLLWRSTGVDRLRARRWAVAGALGLAVASFAWALWLGQTRLALAFFASPARAWELLAGASLALQQRGGAALPARWAGGVALAGLGAVLVAAFGLSHDSPHPGWLTWLPVGGAVALIAGLGAAPGSVLARVFGSAPLRALGARSYAIYLWHWPVLMLGNALWADRSVLSRLVWLALSVALAEAGFRGVESPARWRWAQGWPAPRLLRWALAGSAVVVLAGFGLRHAADAGGWSQRQALPPLAQVQNDLSVVYANGCHLGVEATVPAANCRLGEGAATLLLFGDSHAAQWVPALLPAAAARGHAVLAWTKSSCPSADVTVWNPAARGPYRECDAWREAVFARLAEARPAFVVVANLDDAASEFVDRATGVRLSGPAAAAAFDAGLQRTLQRLRAAGVPAVLLRDNPKPRKDVLNCLYRGGGAGAGAACDRPRAEALPAEGADGRAARATGTPLWDLADAACGPTACPALRTGADGRTLVVYRDDNHFGARFVVTLAPVLGRAWDAAPPRR
ncbi:MAG: acyltransferase [Rubrivivax sp.]|nr:acyltransferase [Rubrivivax sp.]MBP6465571.1 acyltransferase [Rubrivivax sp.]